MRSAAFAPVLALAAALGLPGARVSAQPSSGVQVDIGIFYDELAPYGDWVEMPDYGWSWAPRVDDGWRPYTRGQWVMTDDGWYWDSDERFGWAAYHYGRWVDDPYYGWVWVPGNEWAPAWVSWRHGNGYTGWAPLPPRAAWRDRVGLSIGGLEIDAFIGARDYSFVPDRSFVDRGIYQRVLPPTQNVTIINETTNVTSYTEVNRRIHNGGIPVANVERAVGRGVPRVRTVDVDRFNAPRRAGPGEVAVYRPEVRSAPGRKPTGGRSIVRGEEPPPDLVVRRKAREQERQQGGNPREVTARDVQQKGPQGPKGPPGPGGTVRGPAPGPAPEPRAKGPEARPQPPRAEAPPRPEPRPEAKAPRPQQAEPPRERPRPEAKAPPAPRPEAKAPPPPKGKPREDKPKEKGNDDGKDKDKH